MSPTSSPALREAARLTRAAAVVVTAVAAGAVVGRLFWTVGAPSFAAVIAAGPDTPTDLLLTGACAVGLGLTAWLVLGVLLATAAALPGALGRAAAIVADRWAPALVRRAVAAVVGGAIVAGMPVAAHAGPPRPGPVATQVAVPAALDPAFTVTDASMAVIGSTTPTPTPLAKAPAGTATPTAPDPAFGVTTETAGASGARSPSRPAPTLGPLGPAANRSTTTDEPATARTPAPTTAPAPALDGTVRVRRGDTLWTIAARHLGTYATPAAIAKEWPRWYAANRRLVGADPDLILPGQVLTAPTPTDPSAQQGAPS